MVEDNSVAAKNRRLFFGDIDQVRNVIANGALAVFIESRREPHRAAVGQRTEAGVEMIKPRIDQLDRNDKAA